MRASSGFVAFAPSQRGGVNEGSATSFRVCGGKPAHLGGFHLYVVDELKGHQIVPSGGPFQDVSKTLVLQVADQECDGALFHDPSKMRQCRGHICALAFWLQIDDFPDDAQDMAASLLGWDEPFDAVTEQDGADFVVVLACGKSQYGSQFSGQFPLGLHAAPEGARCAHIDEQHGR